MKEKGKGRPWVSEGESGAAIRLPQGPTCHVEAATLPLEWTGRGLGKASNHAHDTGKWF